MKLILNLILVYCLIVSQAFGQATNPNDQMKIGDKSSLIDKGFTFETGDGVSNKKLLVEKISKKLKWNGNSVQIGDGSASSDKELIIAGALKSLKYNGTSGEFEFNDDVKLIGSLKTDIIQAINSEVDVKNILRAELGVKFGTGNAEIKYDTGLNSLVFSNDGTLYKKVGSGSGGGDGGVSILKNGSFEDGDINWTSTGGSHVISSYTNGTESDLKYATFTATSASQTFCSDLATTPSYFGAGGMVDFTYTGTGTAFLMYVADSLGNKLTAPQALLNQTSWTKLSPIPFSFNTSQKVCFESVSASSISLDKVYLGSNKNITDYTSTSKTYDQSTVTITGVGWSNTTAKLVPYKTTSKTTGLPEWRLNYNIVGAVSPATRTSYNITIGGVSFVSTIAGTFLTDNNVSPVRSYVGGSIVYVEHSSGSTSFYSVSGDVALTSKPTWADDVTSTQVQTPEASQWFIDANIGGSNIDVGTSAVTSYTDISNANLDLVQNQGSSNVQIACLNGNDSTGLTCTGGTTTENLGVTFTNPYSGLYEACFDFSYTASNGNTSFQLVETNPASSSIVQEGKTRVMTYVSTSSLASSFPVKACGTFTFSDVKRRTIRLAFEKSTTTVQLFQIDRDSLSGQRDMHITVRPLLQNSLRAILTGDQVTTTNVEKPVLFSFSFGTGSVDAPCTSSPCSYLDQVGNYVSSVTRNAAGSYYANFIKTFNKVKCTKNVSGASQGSSMFGTLSCSNCNKVLVRGVQSTANTDMDVYGDLICHGY